MEALLLEGLESGKPVVADEKVLEFALKTEAADLLQSRKKKRTKTKRK